MTPEQQNKLINEAIEEAVKLLNNAVEKIKNPRVIKHGTRYYYLTGDGEIATDVLGDHLVHSNRCKIGNAFTTKEAAAKHRQFLIDHAKLMSMADGGKICPIHDPNADYTHYHANPYRCSSIPKARELAETEEFARICGKTE